MKLDEEITSVARRYREGAFNVKEGWQRLGIHSGSWWSLKKIAAAIAVTVAVCATAAIIVYRADTPTTPEPIPAVEPAAPRYTVRTIDFEDAPLGTVLEKIQEIYEVKLADVPVNADDFRLTLRYEGNADDLVATINDIFGTEIKIEQ